MVHDLPQFVFHNLQEARELVFAEAPATPETPKSLCLGLTVKTFNWVITDCVITG